MSRFVEVSFPHTGFEVEIQEGKSGEIDTTVIRIPLGSDSVVVRDGFGWSMLLSSVQEALELHRIITQVGGGSTRSPKREVYGERP